MQERRNSIANALELRLSCTNPDSKVHGANMGPTWVLWSPGGPHVGPMNLAIWEPIDLYYINKSNVVIFACSGK